MQGMQSSSEYCGIHGNVGFVEILGAAKHV
jgi:hypothetical protein